MHTTPASLLDRLRRPAEQAAWGRFVRLYTPLLYHWARRAGLRGADAADLVQDVLTLLVRKLPEFVYDRDRSFRAWLRTVTLNTWRAQRRRAALPAAAPPPDLDEVPGPDVMAAFEEAEYRAQVVRRALDVLRPEFPPHTWQAFSEYVLAGRDAADVAAELGARPGAVYLAKSRVLARLRQELAGLAD